MFTTKKTHIGAITLLVAGTICGSALTACSSSTEVSSQPVSTVTSTVTASSISALAPRPTLNDAPSPALEPVSAPQAPVKTTTSTPAKADSPSGQGSTSSEKTRALRSAESYSRTMNMSKRGIYEQLTAPYGEQFTAAEAQYAVDNL